MKIISVSLPTYVEREYREIACAIDLPVSAVCAFVISKEVVHTHSGASAERTKYDFFYSHKVVHTQKRSTLNPQPSTLNSQGEK